MFPIRTGVPLVESAEDFDEVPGLKSDEYAASLATLQSVGATLNAECVLLRERFHGEGKELKTGQYLMRKRCEEKDFLEIRIAVVGEL